MLLQFMNQYNQHVDLTLSSQLSSNIDIGNPRYLSPSGSGFFTVKACTSQLSYYKLQKNYVAQLRYWLILHKIHQFSYQ